MMARRWIVSVVTVAWLSLAGGCDGFAQKSEHDLRLCREENVKLKNDLTAANEVIAGQQRQIQTLEGLGAKRLDLLFHVTSLEVGKYSSGLDVDGRPGDDLIRVYLRPLDAVGDPIKAAGTVTIQFYDLAAPPDKNLFATYEFGIDQVAKSWYGGVLTYHYRFECPWKSGPPPHPDVTVRATFTDYLTGKQFTDQKVIKVNLPPTTQPSK